MTRMHVVSSSNTLRWRLLSIADADFEIVSDMVTWWQRVVWVVPKLPQSMVAEIENILAVVEVTVTVVVRSAASEALAVDLPRCRCDDHHLLPAATNKMRGSSAASPGPTQ